MISSRLNEGRLWNVFHDGSICHVKGEVPGPLELTIEFEYLRELFLPEGEAFIIHLEHCVLFRFDSYDSEMNNDIDMEILSCRVDTDVLKVFCVEGILNIEYRTAYVTLDSGSPITLQQLESTAQAYWDDFSKR